MPQFHKHYPANLLGRDFVVGDLHGCLHLLRIALDRVSFDQTKDRLFSVGDLVDRGPDNVGTLRFFLENHWAVAVRGNHEDMMIRFQKSWAKQEKWPYLELDKDGRRWLFDEVVPQVAQWPLALTVDLPGTGNHNGRRFHVVHAELFAGCQDADPAHPDTLTDQQVSEAINSAGRQQAFITGYDDHGRYHDRLLWGRSLVREFRDRFRAGYIETERENGLSPVYCGHTICPKIPCLSWRYRSHRFIDTGSFVHYRNPDLKPEQMDYYGLTLVNAKTGEEFFVRGDTTA